MSERLELGADEAGALARAHGTPFYLYDLDVLRARIRRARRALSARLLYAVKANPNLEILRAVRSEVDGLDLSSAGELELAERAGWSAELASFAGPAKTAAELEVAVERGVSVSLESLRELAEVASLARRLGHRARVMLRLNPIAAALAYRVRMIGGPSPFGIDEEELGEVAHHLSGEADALELRGIHVHPGGQCTSLGGFSAAVRATLDLAARLEREHGIHVPAVNFGGGFGIVGEGPGEELDVEAAGVKLAEALSRWTATFGHAIEPTFELGRWLVAPAGVYVARVISEKISRGTHHVFLDGGLNHHLGATGHLYGPTAPRLPIVNLSRPEAPLSVRTLVGPLCTPLDTFGAITLAEPRVGDLVGVRTSGAYGHSFSPLLFLGHPLPAELVREAGTVRVARRARSVVSLLD